MSISRTFSIGREGQLLAFGLGTFQGDNGNEQVKNMMLAASKLGYRHFYTAAVYGSLSLSVQGHGKRLASDEENKPDTNLRMLTKLWIKAYEYCSWNMPIMDYELSQAY
ncbi:hypothetical protein HYFRA_00004715 [Hymenoscyphus fraxineus]|uniref:NADP-dependent oxidoreductase domain-containing protein n=1 Tax=Hymenoscyphus fraxineus TaxID=746836 RepID=A0A9N9KV08_9HELO|nr:hypothetical protein HYFRA_00004715 [Hymenoscyphus fraxineus]